MATTSRGDTVELTDLPGLLDELAEYLLTRGVEVPTPGTPAQPPRMGSCPAGGDHAPIPIQGGGGNQCAKCGSPC